MSFSITLRIKFIAIGCMIYAALSAAPSIAAQEGGTSLYWGDTHLHTSFSADAYMLGNETADPNTAFRFAKGLPVVHPGHGARVTIDRPLDFLVVSDHAEFLGVMSELIMGNPELTKTELGNKYRDLLLAGKQNEVFADIVSRGTNSPETLIPINTPGIRSTIWAKAVEIAEAHNQPGTFTSFIGWEWSSMPGAKNLHRVVFTPDGADKALNYVPYSLFDSQKPRDLWNWLAETSEKYDTDFISIGHNMNLSLGRFFPEVDEDGKAIDLAYAQARQRWEPVEEIVQYKGDSETHPILSPDDEFADFETYKTLLGRAPNGDNFATPMVGSFVRSGLRRGLEIETRIGENPYKFGVIGSTDSHTGLSSVQEDNYMGKYGADSTPRTKGLPTTPGSVGWDAGAQGLAAVWATSNTREAISAAFKRREVFATSGPRILLRMFAGWSFEEDDANAVDIAAVGYAKGVPMGADILTAPENGALSFLVQAVKDPTGANLDRLQIIKGWVDSTGQSYEKIYTIAWSCECQPDEHGDIPAMESRVNLETGTYDNESGSLELVKVWTDPDFDPSLNAFYYTRVLEVPTPRHTVLDTIALEQPPETSGHPAVIQERAYSSPIWYSSN